MEIIYQTTDNKVALVNAINSQESVKDYKDIEFVLHNVVVYRATSIDENGKESEDTISCFFVESEKTGELTVSSISPVVFNGVEALLAVYDDYNVDGIKITFKSRKTSKDRDCIYFVVR